VTVKFIATDPDVAALKGLIGKPVIGMDSEWRPQLTKFDKMRPAVFQICDSDNVYLVDLIALAESKPLDDLMTELLTSPDTIFVGFNFKTDLA